VEARTREIAYFRAHSQFSQVSPSLFGVANLTTVLTKLLIQSIKRSLPGIKWDLERMLEDTTRKITLLGHDVPTDEREKQSVLMERIAAYCKLLRLSSRGDYREELLASVPETRLHAKLQRSYKVLQEGVLKLRPQGVNSPELLTVLENEMVSQRGRELPGFLSSQVFYGQMIDHVENWRPLVDQCMLDVAAQTRAVLTNLSAAVMPQLPRLAHSVQGIATELIESMLEDTAGKLEALIGREQDPFTAQVDGWLTALR
jgi:hypothetical protein